MKFYKLIKSSHWTGNKLIGRYAIVWDGLPWQGRTCLIATPDLPTVPGYGNSIHIENNGQEVKLEDIKFLIPHLPKIIKQKLGIIK